MKMKIAFRISVLTVWVSIFSARAFLFEPQNHLSFFVGGDGNRYPPAETPQTILAVAERLGDTVIVRRLTRAGFEPIFTETGPLTFFAPTNDAANSLSEELQHYLASNRTANKQVVTYHVIADFVESNRLHDEMLLPTLNGNNIRINIYKGGKVITASGARITLPDQHASNGILHEVSRVLLPPMGTAKHAINTHAGFSILSRALSAAGFDDELDGEGPFTLFAPTNDAFTSLPVGVLEHLLNNTQLLQDTLAYHLLMGTHYSAGFDDNSMLTTIQSKPVAIHFEQEEAVFVNDARVVQADVTVTNGCIHAIDKVLLHDALHFELVHNHK